MKKILVFIKRIKAFYWTCLAKIQIGKGGYGKSLTVNEKSLFNHRVRLGDNCNFNGVFIYGRGSVDIGNNFHSGRDIIINTSNHNYEGDAIPYDRSHITQRIIIEDNVWVGHRALILGNTRIGEGAIVGAGCVVTKDVPKCAIVGGNPARILKYRNIEHYESLKSQGKFH